MSDFKGSLSEFLALRDTDPDRYERIMEEVIRRADAAQRRLLERRADQPE